LHDKFCFTLNRSACFNQFSQHLNKPVFIMLDNAKIHTSHQFEEMIPLWRKKKLFVHYLPSYSPELNLIENLWRFIKYSWFPSYAYLSFEALVENGESILRNFGSEWIINFT